MSSLDQSPTPIRILIVDDHGMVRFGLRAYIESVPNLSVVGEAANAEEALQLMETRPVDVVLMDLVLPGMSGADATREISRRYPSAKVIILTSFVDDAHVFPAIRAGAAGYLLAQIAYMVFYFLFMGTMIFAGMQPGKLSDSPFSAILALFFFFIIKMIMISMILREVFLLLLLVFNVVVVVIDGEGRVAAQRRRSAQS
jgi:CheY-like chemotaxis protein